MKILDVCAGIGAFSYAAKQVDNGSFYTTIGCSEICSFSNKVLDKEGYELYGDICKLGVPENHHPDRHYLKDDLVPCEESNFSSVTYEDIFEGAVEFDMLIAGTPCQDISQANLGNNVGIDGDKSKIVYEVMRLVEDFEPELVLLENTSALIRKGLHVLIQLFDRLGYVVEWQTVSAANFGYSHYRHRTFVVAYLKGSTLHKSGMRVFDLVSKDAKYKPGYKVPLPENMTQEQREFTRVIDTRAIKLRTKRINALGNSVVVDIAVSILNAIAFLYKESHLSPITSKQKLKREKVIGYITQTGIEDDVNHSLFDISSPITKLPPAGYLDSAIVYDSGIDYRLNPKRTEYKGMLSTLLSRDGNNNCSTTSRANRPGKLGGIIGDLIVMFGFTEGGLNPNFGESMLGLPQDYTNIF